MRPLHTYKGLLILSVFTFFIIACRHFEPSAPKDEEVLDGPVEGLTDEQRLMHARGDAAFTTNFTAETGLGPVFVATSCVGCHAGDGKGHPFTALVRYGQTDSTGNSYASKGGPQWQHRAIPGHQPEVLPAGVPFTKLVAPAVTGLGYLDAVEDATLLAMADPSDANGDGISGVPNWIDKVYYTDARATAIQQGGKFIGRFGKKASAYDLLMQTSKAYNQDMGILSGFEDLDPFNNLASDPEITAQQIHDNVFYQKTLKAPPVRSAGNADVIAGKQHFVNIGCAACHRTELKTGSSPIEPLSNKTFYPYTDLLLHDMGSELDDGYTEGSAKTSEWRTAPLWGLGLSKNSQGGSYFLLHDGRAHSIEEAILLHGGEGHKSREAYRNLSSGEKQQLIKFLESL
jgi:CxxC motif-containing protein (DUF1111 family)